MIIVICKVNPAELSPVTSTLLTKQLRYLESNLMISAKPEYQGTKFCIVRYDSTCKNHSTGHFCHAKLVIATPNSDAEKIEQVISTYKKATKCFFIGEQNIIVPGG
ncbi:hypothetical protein ACFQ3S_03925 [Mucilaginibacter terrae]|uniref:hypothetical protein n=1 Tax=Mucilaginibacter terrae TaxID=1955052 RepID=UPI003632D7D7